MKRGHNDGDDRWQRGVGPRHDYGGGKGKGKGKGQDWSRGGGKGHDGWSKGKGCDDGGGYRSLSSGAGGEPAYRSMGAIEPGYRSMGAVGEPAYRGMGSQPACGGPGGRYGGGAAPGDGDLQQRIANIEMHPPEVVIEIAKGLSFEEVQAATGAPLILCAFFFALESFCV